MKSAKVRKRPHVSKLKGELKMTRKIVKYVLTAVGQFWIPNKGCVATHVAYGIKWHVK